jgi:AcrR family transcriptional regulator
MARTQAADYDLRKLAIVEAAAALFAEKGFLGASLVDLAISCSSSKSLIYHYYPSKEDILFDVMASHVEALNDALDDVEGRAATRPRRSAADPRLHAALRRRRPPAQGVAERTGSLPPDRRAEIVSRQRRLILRVERIWRTFSPSCAARAGWRVRRPCCSSA